MRDWLKFFVLGFKDALPNFKPYDVGYIMATLSIICAGVLLLLTVVTIGIKICI
jgi:hypothetical protein